MAAVRHSQPPSKPKSDFSSADADAFRRLRWERLAQIASQDFKVKLDFGPGHGTDGSRVSIQKEADALAERGETLHESAHLFAGSALGSRRAVDLSAGRSPAEALAVHLIWHALEDARAENIFLERYPGADAFLEVRAENDSRRDAELGALHLLVRLAWGMYRTGRGKGAGGLDEDTRLALGVVGPLVERAAACENPEEVADTALEIFRRCAPFFELSEEALSSRGEPPATSGAEDGAEVRFEDRAAEYSEDDEGEVEGEMLLGIEPEELANLSFTGSPRLAGDSRPKEIHPDALAPDERTIVLPPAGRPNEYQDILSEAGSQVRVMVQRLQRVIRERQYVRYAGAYRSGKLNLAKLWKQRTGDYRLFQRKVEPDHLDVAFSLLVDESGSMNRKKKFLVARRASVLCAEALDGISVPFEIIGYSTEASEAVMAHNCGHVPVFQYRHIRHSRLQHRLYKTFDDSFRAVRTRLVHIAPRFNNWDEEHLGFAARRMAGRPENAKVIIIISDGQPNGSVHNLIEEVGELDRRGYRIIAVGIEDDYVRDIYPNHVVVEDMAQLAAELIALLERELLGRRGWR